MYPATAKGTTMAASQAGPARRPGQLPRGGGPGVPLEILLRERDALASKGNYDALLPIAARLNDSNTTVVRSAVNALGSIASCDGTT